MITPLTRECAVHCQRRGRGGHQHLQRGSEPQPGRVPRLARLMALALRFEQLLRSGVVANYRQLASLGHVSPARISQIMNLLLCCAQHNVKESILRAPPRWAYPCAARVGAGHAG